MGKKRKRSKQNAGPASSAHHRNMVWPDRLVDELLSYLNSEAAFLDPITDNRRDRNLQDVNEELARHINHLRDDGESSPEQLRYYSAKQVRAKLAQLYAEYSSTENNDDEWTIIYERGSACLDRRCDSERQVQMARRSREIKHKLRWEFLHSPRKTRAGSQVNAILHSVPRRGLRASSSPSASGVLRRARGSKRTGSHPLKQERVMNDVQSASETESLQSKNRESIVIKAEDVAQTPVVQSTEHDVVKQITPCLQDSREILESEPESYNTPLGSFSAADCGNDMSEERNFEEPPPIVELEARLHAVQKELLIVKRNAKLDVDFWKAQYSSARNERLKWKRAKDILAAELNVLRSSNSTKLLTDRIVEREALLDDLIDQRNSRQRIQDLKSTEAVELDDETLSKVSKLMRRIRDCLWVTFKDINFASVGKLQTLPQDHLLMSLVQRAFGIEWDCPVIMKLLERWHERSELRHYGLLALCGAALSHWVFQQTQADVLFDRYQGISTQSSTNRYRAAIQAVEQSDPALARTVDLIVHKSLAEDDGLEHFQKAKAKDLARRFLEALAPLCELDLDTGELSDADSEGDGYAVDSLSDAFASAIDVQLQLVLTGRRFECAWHEPGALFDRKSMSTLGREQESGATDDPTIRLTLVPGINLVTASSIGVDFGGFAERRHKDQEQAECLVRAVVLRGSADLP